MEPGKFEKVQLYVLVNQHVQVQARARLEAWKKMEKGLP